MKVIRQRYNKSRPLPALPGFGGVRRTFWSGVSGEHERTLYNSPITHAGPEGPPYTAKARPFPVVIVRPRRRIKVHALPMLRINPLQRLVPRTQFLLVQCIQRRERGVDDVVQILSIEFQEPKRKRPAAVTINHTPITSGRQN